MVIQVEAGDLTIVVGRGFWLWVFELVQSLTP